MADGITIAERGYHTIAAIMARKGTGTDAIGAKLMIDPPVKPGWATNGLLSLVGTGPGTWLLLAETVSPELMCNVQRNLTGIASISDQSGGYIVFRLSGPKARVLLQRGVAIDLHPDGFRRGSAASTVIAHISVILWQVDDMPAYEVAVFRSYAASFRHWLETTSAALD